MSQHPQSDLPWHLTELDHLGYLSRQDVRRWQEWSCWIAIASPTSDRSRPTDHDSSQENPVVINELDVTPDRDWER